MVTAATTNTRDRRPRGPAARHIRYFACVLVMVAISSCQFAGNHISNGEYAFWATANPDGSWTAAAEAAVRDTPLASGRPADIGDYCPEYSDLASEDKVKFWVGLLSAMAEFESDLDPQTQFTESLRNGRGEHVVSRGLLQISIESANQQRYACQIESEQDLHDPATNIQCATRILSHWVTNDGVIASGTDGHRGGARYWSVLRDSRNSAETIRSMTSQLSFCST